MPKEPFQIVGDFAKVKQKGINPERTVNFYAVNLDDAKTSPALVCTQGLEKTLTLAMGSKIRQFYTDTKNLVFYVVCSQYVYKLDINFNPLLIGKLNTVKGFVNISQNNATQIMFVDQDDGWIYDYSSNIFTQIDFPDNFNPQSLTFMDTYFITTKKGTNSFYLSNNNDGTTWDAQQFSQMQSQSDKLVSVVALKRQLFVIGEITTEIWADQGQLDFPFVRDNTILFQYGAAALGSVIQGLDMLFWLSRNKQGVSSIMMTDGGLPVPISSLDMDQEITDYEDVSDCRAYMYQVDGHQFVSFSFPKANKTWTYDITTKFWFNQEMQDKSNYIVNTTARFGNVTYAGHYNMPIIYHMHGDFLTNDGLPINRTRICHRFNMPNYEMIEVHYLELDIVQGVGTTSGQGKIPNIELQVSFDAGITYTKKRIGKISQLGNTQGYRTQFWNLGINKDFVFKIICYDPVDLTIRGAAIDYDVVGN